MHAWNSGRCESNDDGNEFIDLKEDLQTFVSGESAAFQIGPAVSALPLKFNATTVIPMICSGRRQLFVLWNGAIEIDVLLFAQDTSLHATVYE